MYINRLNNYNQLHHLVFIFSTQSLVIEILLLIENINEYNKNNAIIIKNRYKIMHRIIIN